MMEVGSAVSVAAAPNAGSRRDAGSFRDPSGFVYVEDGVLYRQVNVAYQPDYDLLIGSGLAAHLIERQMMVPFEEVPLGASSSPSAYKRLAPERVPFISYPYEWCFSQLRDAALLTLRLQAKAIGYGMSLKDASAFNIQFLRGKPVLIDTLSFERYVEGTPWVAYRQFCQHFLAPLALMAFCDVRLNQLAKVFIDGVPLDLAASLLPKRTWLRPALAMHLHVHARAQKKHSDAGRASNQATPAAKSTVSRTALLAMLESLAGAIRKLEYTPEGTEWADYYANTNYSDASLDDKARLVAEMVEHVVPQTVWDLGANTGRFSRIASQRGVPTVAFDIDPAAVERNYRQTAAAGETTLLPLVLDLSNPSPSLGWASEERRSIAARGPVDLVMALALIHHLAIGNNVPLPEVARFLARVARSLIIEFVPKPDSQVQRLLATREDVFDEYTDAHFRAAFEQHFIVERVVAIPNTVRTLYLMRLRNDGASE